MNGIVKTLGKLPVRFWLQVLALVLALVPLAYIIMRIKTSEEYPLALAFVLCSLVAEGFLFAFPNKKFSGYLAILCAILLALAMSYFILGGVLSVVDYIYGISLFGDSSQFPAIIGYSVVMVLSTVSGVACCFFVKE